MADKGLFISLVETMLQANEAKKQRLFFVTYPQYGKPTDLLSALQESIQASTHLEAPTAKKRVGTFLVRWVENCPEDFENDKKLGEDMLSFARDNLTPSITNHLKLKYLRNTRRAQHDVAVISTPFNNVRPRDIAYYLTLIDWRYFSAIRASELFDQAWQKHNHSVVAPNITCLTQKFNTLSLWVADLIIESYSRSTHTAVVEKVIEILKELFKINNYSSGMAVLSALNHSSVQRLRGLWTNVRKEHRDCVNHFEQFMDMSNNFKRYRKHLGKTTEEARTKKTPLIPFLPLFLRDITFIRDGNSDTKDHQLNVEKLELQGKQILQLQEWQRTPYSFNFTCDEAYYNFFDHLVAPKEDELFDKSLRLLPGPVASNFRGRSDSEPTTAQVDEDTLSLGSDVGEEREAKPHLSEYSEGFTDDLSSVSDAEELLREAGTDNMIDFELDKAESMLTTPPRSPDSSRQFPAAVDSIAAQRERANTEPWECTSNNSISGWQLHDVADWLRRTYLSKHIAAFMEAGVDGERLQQADHKFLSTLGLSSFKDRKMVLMRIDKLKQEHDVSIVARVRTGSLSSGLASTEPTNTDQLLFTDSPPTADSGEEIETSLSLAHSKSKTTKDKPEQERSPSVSEENDQQVGSDSEGTKKRKKSTKGRSITTERIIGTREVGLAAPSSPNAARAWRPSLFRSSSKSFSPVEAPLLPSLATSTPTAQVVDVESLGGATVLICCEEERWNGGKLGPYSYDKLVQAIIDRHDHIFSSAGQVGIVCTGFKKGGTKIKSDKDLRQLKVLAKERNEKVVVFNVQKHS